MLAVRLGSLLTLAHTYYLGYDGPRSYFPFLSIRWLITEGVYSVFYSHLQVVSGVPTVPAVAPRFVVGQKYQFPSGETVRITAIVIDWDTEEVILVLESAGIACVSDLLVSEFLALRPERVFQ